MADQHQPTERDRTAELYNLRADNERREKALVAQGMPVDPAVAAQIQLRALVAMVVGDDPERQREYELAYQHAVSEAFDAVEAQMARAKLAVPTPANGRSPLHLPGRG